MYNLPRQLLVANSLNRYKLSNASEGLVKNSDGSMTLCLQHDAPQGREAESQLAAYTGGSHRSLSW
jgi:hypothetical protein